MSHEGEDAESCTGRRRDHEKGKNLSFVILHEDFEAEDEEGAAGGAKSDVVIVCLRVFKTSKGYATDQYATPAQAPEAMDMGVVNCPPAEFSRKN